MEPTRANGQLLFSLPNAGGQGLCEISGIDDLIIFIKFSSHFQNSFALFFKRPSEEYRKVIEVPEYEACQFYISTADNKLVKQIVEIAAKIAKGLVQPCPYDSFSFFNLTMPVHDLLLMLPTGRFKLLNQIKINDRTKRDINYTLEFSINSINERLGRQ
jgi:hypothetical protein